MTKKSNTEAVQLISDVTEQSFETEVIERSKQTPVLVDFWAAWCGPCRMLGPQIEAAVKAKDGDVLLAKVDTEAQQQLAARFKISGIPHVKLFSKEREVANFTGAKSQAMIEQFLEQHLGPTKFELLNKKYEEAKLFEEPRKAFALGYNDQAMQQLLEFIEKTQGDERDQAREFLIAAFEDIGADNPAVIRYRKLLATALF